MRQARPKSGLLEAIAQGGRPLGMFVACTDAAITDIAGVSGFDFVILDAEHGPIDPGGGLGHVRAAEAAGMLCMARVAENSPALIGQFLDIGCQAIIVPHVDNAEEAAAAVKASRYAPKGMRSMGVSHHAALYAPGRIRQFMADADQEILLGVIIESVKGVENVESIAAVDGVDFVFFGPGDYSLEVGAVEEGWNSPAVQAAWKRVAAATKDRGKLLMGVTLPGAKPGARDQLFADGADLVVLFEDVLHIQLLFEQLVAAN